jgi:hypothetical protein
MQRRKHTMSPRTLICRPRLAISSLAAAALTAGLLSAAPATAADEPTNAQRATAATNVIARNAKYYDETVSHSVATNYQYLLAMAAAGSHGKPAPEGRAWYLLDALKERATRLESDPTKSPVMFAGSNRPAVTNFDEISAALHTAAVYGQDTATFAGRNLATELEGFFFDPAGVDAGWFKTTTTGTAKVTPILQARGVLALNAAGKSASAHVAAEGLIRKQLASGAWSNSYTGTAANFESTVRALIALNAESSDEADTAAAKVVSYLTGLQLENGSFTGGATPVLAGLAANALKGAGATEAASKATAFVASLQSIESTDPIFAGGIGSTVADVAKLSNGSYAPGNYSTLTANTLAGILAFGAPLGALSLTDPGTPRPAVEGNDSYTEGACNGNEGVTMVVDFGYIAPDDKKDPIVRCALGTQITGWATLENAGIHVGSVPGFEGGALCMLDEVPVQGYPYCWLDEGYWSYWHAEPGEVWTYSQLGASNRSPELGSVEGWRFVPLAGAGVPPRVGPTFSEGIDTTAPNVEFQSGPSGTVDGGVKWKFIWTIDDIGATLECRLDDEEWVACDEQETWDAPLSHTIYNVANGDHVFDLRATDVWGNAVTISRAFTVVTDGNAPVVAITSTPGTLTNVTTASFKMTVDDPEATVQCKLDDAEWIDCTSRTTQNYAGLAAGEHTFSYRATDLTGNVGTVSHTWRIDSEAPPVVTISGGTSAYTSTTSNASANFAIAESGTVVSRECKLDDADWGACYSTTRAYWTGLSLANGSHTIAVRATNAAGKTSEVATSTFNVDTVKPVVEVLTKPEATTKDRDAQVGFVINDASPMYSLTCDVDGAGAKACSSPVDLTNLSLGAHSVKIQARDMAFNYSDAVTVSWTVERNPATVATTTVSGITQTAASATVLVTAGNVDQSVAVEVDDPSADIVTTPAQALAAGASESLGFDLTGLKSNTAYKIRFVSTSSDGEIVNGEWTEFRTAVVPAFVGTASVGTVSKNAATVTVPVTAGDVDQLVRVEYSTKADGSGAVSMQAQLVPASAVADELSFELTGLAPGQNYTYRVVAEATNGLSVTTDWAHFGTASPNAPSVALSSSVLHATVGDAVTLTWSATDAESLTATGDWSGHLDPAGGTKTIEVDRAGTFTFSVEALGDGGRTHATIVVEGSLAAKSLSVSVPSAVVLVGHDVAVQASGLAADEPYTITVGGIPVATGTANSAGLVARSVTVPTALAEGIRFVQILGSNNQRVGEGNLSVVRAKTLSVKVSKKWVVRGKKVRVTVRGLAAGESVKVRLLGKTWRGTANAKGVYVKTVKVTKKNAKKVGRKKVTVTGLDATRKGNTTFKVKK